MPYLYVVTANLLFAISSLVYARFARSQSILWMNIVKTSVALTSSLVFLSLLGEWTQTPTLALWPFFLSGAIGLACGDMFLISAFARIGSARTMVLWGFQPVFVAIGAYFLFEEVLEPQRLFAALLLVSCLLTFSFEGFKKKGHWELKGLSLAMAGVLLDAVGLFFSRYGFESTTFSPLEANFYRCVGAVGCFAIFNMYFPCRMWSRFRELDGHSRSLVLMASFFGTFLAIFLSLSAIQIGHLPSIAALSITTPLFAAMFEHIYERKWPSKIFLFAFAQFVVGFLLLIGYKY